MVCCCSKKCKFIKKVQRAIILPDQPVPRNILYPDASDFVCWVRKEETIKTFCCIICCFCLFYFCVQTLEHVLNKLLSVTWRNDDHEIHYGGDYYLVVCFVLYWKKFNKIKKSKKTLFLELDQVQGIKLHKRIFQLTLEKQSKIYFFRRKEISSSDVKLKNKLRNTFVSKFST